MRSEKKCFYCLMPLYEEEAKIGICEACQREEKQDEEEMKLHQDEIKDGG